MGVRAAWPKASAPLSAIDRRSRYAMKRSQSVAERPQLPRLCDRLRRSEADRLCRAKGDWPTATLRDRNVAW
ncbi:MAG: hypothetical protein F6K26_49525 [Moorea sp. SIO2I5]|nr:hypothetical protein [Moorena sp. SIO2I5]